jgi:hypothetical protein
MKVSSIPCSGVPVAGPNEPGSSDSVYPADTEARRMDAPWYTSKNEPSTADMTAKLRRVIIAAKFKPVYPDQPEPAEIHAIRLAREDVEDIAA